MNKMIPSELIHADKSGNAVIGKNIEVDGTTKLNGGLQAIHHYETTDGNTIDVYFENVTLDDYHFFIGKYNDGFAMGAYALESGEISDYTIISIGDPYDGVAYIYVKGTSEIYYPLANENKTQRTLFTHKLTLTADKSYTLVYQSTKELAVNSIADLRTIMNVTSSDNVILPVCATDLSGTAVLQVTSSLCKVATANVTAISDEVTAL